MLVYGPVITKGTDRCMSALDTETGELYIFTEGSTDKDGHKTVAIITRQASHDTNSEIMRRVIKGETKGQDRVQISYKSLEAAVGWLVLLKNERKTNEQPSSL